MNRLLHHTAFAAGLAALGWVAIGHLGTLGSNPLAFAVTLVIAAFYLMGALELQRCHQASTALSRALATPPEGSATAQALGDWLATLPEAWRPAVQQRIEHGRTALPGPALAPTLAGLLVLLGMLGTFLGMVATLHGTGLALERATELDALRDALAAPVKGLGLAFGTSVAGVATSAMLGLMIALTRRERARVTQALDARIATTLRPFSQAHRATLQQQETLQALQRQAEAVPALMTSMVDTVVQPLMTQLQQLITGVEQHSQALQQRLQDDQQQFHARTEAAYGALASSVDRTLRESLADSTRQAAATLQPVVQATMAGLAQEAAALHTRVGETVQQQLATMTERLDAHQATQAGQWQTALERFTLTFEQHAAGLVQDLAARLAEAHTQLQADGATRDAQRLAAWHEGVGTMTTTLRDAWQQAAEQARAQARQGEAAAAQLQAALAGITATFEQRSDALVQGLGQQLGDAQRALQADGARRDAERLAAWQDSVQAMAAALRSAWEQAGERTLAQQQQVCDTLAQTAREITDTTRTQARATVEEIARLLQAAAEAPRAAATVIGELRERLTEAMARDNAMLDERQRLLETLGTLLGAVTQASTEQRSAIDALVAGSAALLQEASERLQAQADTQGAALADAAAQVHASGVEMASLGDAFGFAVQRFGATNEALMAQLQRIEAALSQTLTRSDEQLAYYVAQAREVIDLSLSSQKQIVEDLQQLARRQAA